MGTTESGKALTSLMYTPGVEKVAAIDRPNELVGKIKQPSRLTNYK
jgi:hypothetical protein